MNIIARLSVSILTVIFLLITKSVLGASIYTEGGRRTYLDSNIVNSNYNFFKINPSYYGADYSLSGHYEYFTDDSNLKSGNQIELGAYKTFSSNYILHLVATTTDEVQFGPTLATLFDFKLLLNSAKTSPYIGYNFEKYRSTSESKYYYYRFGLEQIVSTKYSFDIRFQIINNKITGVTNTKKGVAISLDNFFNVNESLRLSFGFLRTCLSSNYSCSNLPVDHYQELSIGGNYTINSTWSFNSQIFYIFQGSKNITEQNTNYSYLIKLGPVYNF